MTQDELNMFKQLHEMINNVAQQVHITNMRIDNLNKKLVVLEHSVYHANEVASCLANGIKPD